MTSADTLAHLGTSARGAGWRIGITIGLHSVDESLWSNGIKQNALYLLLALQAVPQVAAVCLLNTTAVPITSALPWDLNRWPTLPFEAAKDDLDVLIELGGQISAEQTAYLKHRGTRVVSYACGFEYIHAMESVIFGRKLWGFERFFNPRFDAVWMIPQVEDNSRGYFETVLRCPAQVVPFVWSPMCLEQQTAKLPHVGIYQPRGQRAARISVMEPNHNVVKFCLNPVLIAEQAYRAAPELIALLQVTNSERLATESPEFIVLMNQLDLVRDHKAVFMGRHTTPLFLQSHTDVVVSHQWSNPLNYFYLDVCWQGYPLVHNADLVADLGYHYTASDVAQGAGQLLHALRSHDNGHMAYAAQQRMRIARFLPGDAAMTQRYADLLEHVMTQPPR